MLVQEILDNALVRLQGPALCTIYEAVREIQGIITNRLLSRQSEMLRSLAVLSVTAGVTSVALPADYIALAERPYLLGEKALAPLAGQDKSALVGSLLPKYYEILGRTLYLYQPTTTAGMTVQLPYYQRPAVLTTMTGTLPFFGEFDAVFIDGAVAVLSQGLTLVADRAFVAVIQSQVDAVLDAKALIDEQLLADTLNA